MNTIYFLLPAFVWLCLAAYYLFSPLATGFNTPSNQPVAGWPFISSSNSHPVAYTAVLMVPGFALPARHLL